MWLQSRDGPLAARKGETWIWVRFTRWKGRGLVQGSHVFSGVVLLCKEEHSERGKEGKRNDTDLYSNVFMYGLGRQVWIQSHRKWPRRASSVVFYSSRLMQYIWKYTSAAVVLLFASSIFVLFKDTKLSEKCFGLLLLKVQGPPLFYLPSVWNRKPQVQKSLAFYCWLMKGVQINLAWRDQDFITGARPPCCKL